MKWTCFCVVFHSLLIFSLASPAVKHTHHTHNLNQERTQDGGNLPRDHGHIGEDGEHHSEFDHEAILGSVKEAEEFDRLSPAESRRRLGILITKMDLTKDRHIDRNELHAWIIRSFKMLSEEEAKERFDDTDENGDGTVTWEEYLYEGYGIDSEEDRQNLALENNSEDELMADDKEMFKTADQNNDNVLDPEEFLAFSHPEEHPIMLPVLLKQTLRDKDLDRDGLINFVEFLGDKGREHDKDWLIAEKEKFDHEFDKDGDGVLNSNEILSWVVPSNDEIAEEEVDHLFATADDDHDNLLSFEEVLEHHETFVGSEVTDYGDHLNKVERFDDEL